MGEWLRPPRHVEYARCECGYRHENTADARMHLQSGNHCPECGTEITDRNMLRRVHAGIWKVNADG